jgi:hypothetical protein
MMRVAIVMLRLRKGERGTENERSEITNRALACQMNFKKFLS